LTRSNATAHVRHLKVHCAFTFVASSALSALHELRISYADDCACLANAIKRDRFQKLRQSYPPPHARQANPRKAEVRTSAPRWKNKLEEMSPAFKKTGPPPDAGHFGSIKQA
jgi:hypothetical protein